MKQSNTLSEREIFLWSKRHRGQDNLGANVPSQLSCRIPQWLDVDAVHHGENRLIFCGERPLHQVMSQRFPYLGSIKYVANTCDKRLLYHNVTNFTYSSFFFWKASGTGTFLGVVWYRFADCCHHSDADKKYVLLRVRATFKVCRDAAGQWAKPTLCTPMFASKNTKEEIMVSHSVICMFLWVYPSMSVSAKLVLVMKRTRRHRPATHIVKLRSSKARVSWVSHENTNNL